MYKTTMLLSAIILSGCAGATPAIKADNNDYNIFGLSDILSFKTTTINYTAGAGVPVNTNIQEELNENIGGKRW